MTSIYQGLLIRNNVSDEGGIPGAAPFDACPDIIPWSQMPMKDTEATFGSASGTPESYDKNPGVAIDVGNVNYIYARARNFGNAPASGQFNLFYTPSELLLWPSQWMTDQFRIKPDTTASSGASTLDLSAGPGAIAAGSQPFVWMNPQVPEQGTSYYLIGLCGTAEQIEAMRNEASGPFKSLDDLNNWLARNGGAAMRAVTASTDYMPSFSTMTSFQQGAEAASIQFTLNCENCPAGAEVAFSATAPNIGGDGFLPISIVWTQIPIPRGGKPGDTVPSFTLGMTTKVAAGYSSGVYYQYRSNGHATPSGLRISFQAVMVSAIGAAIAASHSTDFPG